MTKKEIEKLLRAIKQLCKTGNCEDCIMRLICRDIPSCMTNSDIDVMANELEKEVKRNE